MVLLAAGACIVGALVASGASAEESTAPTAVPTYATEKLLVATGHVTSPLAAEAPWGLDFIAPIAVEPETPVVKESRSERLQRVLKLDGETAARLVPLIMSFREDLPDALAYDIALAIARESRQHSLRPELVAALIKVESNYTLTAVSPTNDHGLMQLHGDRIYDVERNISMGCQELATWRSLYQCDEREMLAHYNGGNRPPGVSWKYADKVLSLAQMPGEQAAN
jgi:soluble lytic murein transglycosylase-like protein